MDEAANSPLEGTPRSKGGRNRFTHDARIRVPEKLWEDMNRWAEKLDTDVANLIRIVMRRWIKMMDEGGDIF